MVEAWVAYAWVVTGGLLPVAVWAGMVWGRMAEQDRHRREVMREQDTALYMPLSQAIREGRTVYLDEFEGFQKR